MLPAVLDQLRRGLADGPATAALVTGRPARQGRPAAVLVLVDTLAGGPRIVFVEKSTTLRRHAGQIAFPGGAIEPNDGTVVAAALREAQEEIGLDPTGVRVLGCVPGAHVAASGFDVATVVGWWRRPSAIHAADPREIAGVHQIAVADLVRPDARSTAVHPWGYRGPAFAVGDLYIWGFTGHLLDGILDLAGWSVPWDVGVESEIPQRFLIGRP